MGITLGLSVEARDTWVGKVVWAAMRLVDNDLEVLGKGGHSCRSFGTDKSILTRRWQQQKQDLCSFARCSEKDNWLDVTANDECALIQAGTMANQLFS